MKIIYRIFGAKHSHHYQLAFFKGYHYKVALIPFVGSMGGAKHISADLKVAIDTNLPLQMLNAAFATDPLLLGKYVLGCMPDLLPFTSENLSENFRRMQKCFTEYFHFSQYYIPKIKNGKLQKDDIDYELAAKYLIVLNHSKNNMPCSNHFCYNPNSKKLYPTAFEKVKLLEINHEYYKKTFSNYEFYWGDCRDIMKQWDTPDTVTIMDPPYMNHEPDYRGESKLKSTEDDVKLHKDIAEFAKKAKGTVFLNYQPNPLLDQLYDSEEFLYITKRRHCRYSNTFKQELMIFKNHSISKKVLLNHYSEEVKNILPSDVLGRRKRYCREAKLKALEMLNTNMFTIQEVMAIFKIRSATTLRNWRLKEEEIKDADYCLIRLKVLLGKKQLRTDALGYMRKLKSYKVSYAEIIKFTTSKRRRYSYRELRSFFMVGKWPQGTLAKCSKETPPNGPTGGPAKSVKIIPFTPDLLSLPELLRAA